MNAARSLGKFAKAIFAGLVSGLSGLATVLDGGHTIEHVSDGQWVTIAMAALVAFGGVAGISNSTAAK